MKHNKKIKKVPVQEPLDLGKRKIFRQNSTEVLTLPKVFTENFLCEAKIVKVAMSANGSLTITPICKSNKKGDKK